MRDSSFEHPKSNLSSLVHSHPIVPELQLGFAFSSAAEIGIWPDCATVRDGFFVYFVQANLSVFLEEQFLRQHILDPDCSFLAVSLSSEDAAAITPDRKLRLRLSQRTYERLGLLGRRSSNDAGESCTPPAAKAAAQVPRHCPHF